MAPTTKSTVVEVFSTPVHESRNANGEVETTTHEPETHIDFEVTVTKTDDGKAVAVASYATDTSDTTSDAGDNARVDHIRFDRVDHSNS